MYIGSWVMILFNLFVSVVEFDLRIFVIRYVVNLVFFLVVVGFRCFVMLINYCGRFVVNLLIFWRLIWD